jgi:TolB-like protein/class 3 adenylate cyclase
MEEVTQKRQLAAIMFTDIVGYTALMGESEEKALHTRRINREIHQQTIEAVGGIWLKEMGDGTMASFDTVTEAVQAAIEIRKICKKELGIELKIGIHLGEIIHEDEDVFGDGVNIASRIQELATGGGILISEPVYKNIRNKEDIKAAFVGETTLKNVEGPVKLYQLLDADLQKPTIHLKTSAKRNQLLGIGAILSIALLALAYFIIWPRVFYQPVIDRSIAVLPFKNLSPDNENQYFVDGIMADINSHLARLKEIDLLIDPQSTEKYRETNLTTAEIANELGVHYLLTGSGRRAGNNVRVRAQLIDAPTGKIIWSKDYDRELLEIFEVQSEIAKNVAANLQIQLTGTEEEDMEVIPTQNKEAYEAYLKAEEYLDDFHTRGNKVDNDLAVQYYKKAIQLDSGFADPYFELAYAYWLKPRDLGESYSWFDSMPPLIDRGLELQPRAVFAYHVRYLYYWWKAYLEKTPQNLTKAKEALDKIDEIMPNHPSKYGFLANFYDLIQQHDSAVYYMKKNVHSSPNSLDALDFTGFFYDRLDQPQQAKLYFNEVLIRQPDYYGSLWGLCIIYRESGNYEEAVKQAEYLYNINARLGSRELARTYFFKRDFARAEKAILEALAKHDRQSLNYQQLQMYHGYVLWQQGDQEKGWELFDQVKNHFDEHPDERRREFYFSAIQSVVGNKEQAIHYLQQAFQSYYVDYRQVLLDPMFDNIRDDSRVQKLINDQKQKLQKMQDNLAMMEAADELKRLREK